MSLDAFDRVPLLFGRSPVHRFERLSEYLGGQVEVWAKREDCNSGLAYGGNKVRKTIDAIRLCARLEGVLTDPVYEGKSMAALIDLIQSGRIEPGSRVLYAHLGGQPALNAYAGAF